MQETVSHPPGDRLPLLSARPAVTFPAAQHHRPLAGTKIILLGERHTSVNNLPMDITQRLPRVGFETRDRTNRPLLVRDRISNCTNLFRSEPNRTTHAQLITHAADQRCADPEMLRPYQSADSDHRSASPFPTQAPSRSRVSNPSEPGKLGH